MPLVNGADCLSSLPATAYSNEDENQSDGEDAETRLLVPVSKCDFVGMIVRIERRSSMISYLLDDGTGLIDCIDWADDYFTLPPIEGAHEVSTDDNDIQLGDCVRILGRIKSIADLGNEIVREVHITVIQKEDVTLKNTETLHWLQCIHNGRRVTNAPLFQNLFRKSDERNVFPSMRDENSNFFRRIQNGDDIGQMLSDQAAINPDKLHSGWQCFGPNCKCNIYHKHHLLYCHCNASYDSLDPDYRFRDALLKWLLKLEESVPDNKSLFFLWRLINEDESLTKLSKDIVGDNTKTWRLLRKTFAALQNDGIIYLNDEEKDEYLLISRARVLEPYINERKESMLSKNDMPSYLSNVPRSRLRFAERERIKEPTAS